MLQSNDVQVSVLMICYNHERYLSQAIESVLSQQTSFPFEVLIYDDKSTDASRDLISRYQEQHPDIIKCIFPGENQFSKGKSPLCDFLVPAATGKYIAELECDDAWIGTDKLQTQFDYMESHAGVALCAHSAELYNDITGKIDGIASDCAEAMTFSTQDLIMRGGAALPTCGYFSRTTDMKNYLQWRPSNCPVGDWPMMLYLSTCGSVVCLPEVLGLYRVAVASSWTGRRSANAVATAKFDKRMLGMIDELISKMPSEFHASLRAKQAEYFFDLAFRADVSVKKLEEELDYRLEVSSAQLLNLRIKLFVKRIANVLGLMPLIERKMILRASK